MLTLARAVNIVGSTMTGSPIVLATSSRARCLPLLMIALRLWSDLDSSPL